MTDEVVEQAPVETAAPPPEVAEQPKRDKAQERIDELTYKLRQADATIESLKKPPEPKKEAVRPTLEQYGYDEAAHAKAMEEYQELRIAQKAEEAALKLLEKREAEAKARKRDETFSEQFSKLSVEQQDVANRAFVSDLGRDLIKESPVGAQIAHYLGENPELAQSIAQLPDTQQAREIGKLEARFEQKSEAPPPPAPKVSSAPPPAARLVSTDASVSIKATDPDSDKLSDAEWAKAREKQLRRR